MILHFAGEPPSPTFQNARDLLGPNDIPDQKLHMYFIFYNRIYFKGVTV